MEYQDLTETIIGCAYRVYSQIGSVSLKVCMKNACS